MIRKILESYDLPRILSKYFKGKDAGLFMDLVANDTPTDIEAEYIIVSQNTYKDILNQLLISGVQQERKELLMCWSLVCVSLELLTKYGKKIRHNKAYAKNIYIEITNNITYNCFILSDLI